MQRIAAVSHRQGFIRRGAGVGHQLYVLHRALQPARIVGARLEQTLPTILEPDLH